MCFLNRFLIITLLVLEIFFWMPGIQRMSYFSLRLFAAILGLLNASIRPLLLLVSIRVTILTVAAAAFAFNGIAFYIMSQFYLGVHIATLPGGMWAFLIILVASCITNRWIYLETDKF